MSATSARAGSMIRLGIVLGALLAVTLPFWGIFAGGMLAGGDALAALEFLALVAGLIAIPILMVAAFVAGLLWVARRCGARLHPGVAALAGGLVGAAIIMAIAQDMWVALLLGVIPGAGVALAVQPTRTEEDGENDHGL